MTKLALVTTILYVVWNAILVWAIRRSARTVASRQAELAEAAEFIDLLRLTFVAAQACVGGGAAPGDGAAPTDAQWTEAQRQLAAAVAEVEAFELRHSLPELRR